VTNPRDVKRSWLNRMMFAFLTQGWEPQQVADYRRRLTLHDQALSSDVMEAFEQIDAKATGLLTHVSLMIAGLGLVAPLVTSSDVEVSVIVIQIAAYLLIAVGCLRCLSIFRMREFIGDSASREAIVEHELIIRRELYRLCVKASIALTVLVFVLLPILFFWKPGK
jgi:hypothetical protein